MKDFKRLKDPMYGYIEIPSEYMSEIIDTPSFQRLRRIIQTSYSPLYSSAVHNRFVHSIGVYHLGEIAIKQLGYEISRVCKTSLNIKEYTSTFLLACLLHDIGHAPFSHTGESFYLDEKLNYENLHQELINKVNSEKFKNDLPTEQSKSAAPHEIMSAIIGISEFSKFFINSEQCEFFARCITGYKYLEKDIDFSLLNCLISMLNSKVIDVDKLDYLIRDAYITGFDTVNIDFERLLKSLTVIKENGIYEIAYYKNAISVIENVVYAHDSERKWIQSHPIILYESYILEHIFTHLSDSMNKDDRKLFSLETLNEKGISFGENLHIKLLCDDDIMYLMKNVYSNEISEEFFDRRKRRHPVWKSEAEYNALFLELSEGGKVLTDLENAMEATVNYLSKNSNSWVIDDKLIEKIENEINVLETNVGEESLDPKTIEVQIEQKPKILKVAKCLKSYSDDKKLNFNFVVLKVSQFNSGFGKPDFSKINIAFKQQNEIQTAKVDRIVSSLSAKEKKRENFFYLFYKRETKNSIEVDNKDICRRLYKEFID